MPSTYAHFRLGHEVLEQLKGNEKLIIEDYLDLYLIGLHGPDILFYYKPLIQHRINQIGYKTHTYSGRYFFERSIEVINQQEIKEPYIAYIYGVLNHFILDSLSHGYVDEAIEKLGISHTEIEVEFDRYLMIQDKKNPITQKLTYHIQPREEYAHIISKFYPGTNPKDIIKSLKGMIFYNNLITTPSILTRKCIYALLKITGNENTMRGVIVNLEENKVCQESTHSLLDKYNQARLLTKECIYDFEDMRRKHMNFKSQFHYDFGGKLKEREDIVSEV